MTVTKKAVIYARTSNARAGTDSLDRQRVKAEKFARDAGFELVGEYWDRGVSGTVPHTSRPQFGDMLAFCREHDVGDIIVESADRWSRDLIVGEMGLREADALGLSVWSAATGDILNNQDDGDFTRTLVRQILGAVSEAQRKQAAYQLIQARNRASARIGRRVEGRKGHKVHADLVREAKRLRRANPVTKRRRSYRQIATILEQNGWTTASGEKFGPSQVKRLTEA